MRKKILMATIFLLFALQGCLYIVQLDFTPDADFFAGPVADKVLVYGYIDTSVMTEKMENLGIWRVYPKGPSGDVVKYKCIVSKGYFANGNLEPGSYMIQKFYGGDYSFYLGAQSELSYRIYKKGTCNFLGSYKLLHNAGQMKKNEFGVEKLVYPDEKAVIAEVLKKARGTPWEPALKKRLKAIGGA